MNPHPQTNAAPHVSGVMLIECLVYIAVFGVLLGVGTASFYFCWDHTRATIFTAAEIESALRAGERWRADVRHATGVISVEPTATGEKVRIPEGSGEVLYSFDAGELRRKMAGHNGSQLLLAKVKQSEMSSEVRGNVTAWRWDLEVTPRRREPHFPLLFTFEAAQSKP